MKKLMLSTSGRLLALAFGIAVGGTGLAKLMEGPSYGVSAIAVLIGVALTVVGLALAVSEHFGAAVYMIITLPFAAFLAEVGQGLLPRSAGYPMIVAGLAGLAFAARPRISAATDRHPELTLARHG